MKCKYIYSFKSLLVLVIFLSAWIDFSVYSADYLIVPVIEVIISSLKIKWPWSPRLENPILTEQHWCWFSPSYLVWCVLSPVDVWVCVRRLTLMSWLTEWSTLPSCCSSKTPSVCLLPIMRALSTCWVRVIHSLSLWRASHSHTLL